MSAAISKTNESILPANLKPINNFRKFISLVKTREGESLEAAIPLERNIYSLSVDQRNFLYIDNRIVIPQNLRATIMSALHYGHPGRDTMLRDIADIWWPKCHREVINTARFCEDCSRAGKNVRASKTERIRKNSAFNGTERRNCYLFRWPFPECKTWKKYLLVSLDNFSGWPDGLFKHKPTTKKVI